MANTREELLQALREEWRRSSAEGIFYVQAVAERSGMNLTDLQCINVLTLTGPITAGQLAEEMRLTTGAITGLVNRLEQKGYVRRTKDPRDARRVVIEPEPEALERAGVGVFASESAAAWDRLINSYDDQALAILLDFARKTDAFTREETARIRERSTGDADARRSFPLGGVTKAKLVFANGAHKLTLRAASGMDVLYQAQFEGTPPKVEVNDGVVTVRYSRRFKFLDLLDWRGFHGEFALNAAVPWAIEIRSGAAEVDADLSELTLTSFGFSGGASSVRLQLPVPSGTVSVRLSGGASSMKVQRPAGVAARLQVKGGFNSVNFDDQTVGAMGGKMQVQSPGYDTAMDRYEFEIVGGASEVEVQ